MQNDESPLSVARRIEYVVSNPSDDSVKKRIQAGHKIFNEIYRVDRVGVKWRKLLDETVENVLRNPQHFQVPLHVTHSNTDLRIKVIGRTRQITTGEGKDHQVHLNIMKFVDIGKYSNAIAILEYVVEAAGLHHNHMGYARFFYFDGGFVARDITREPLVHDGHRIILKVPLVIPKDVKGFYMSLDLLDQVSLVFTSIQLELH